MKIPKPGKRPDEGFEKLGIGYLESASAHRWHPHVCLRLSFQSRHALVQLANVVSQRLHDLCLSALVGGHGKSSIARTLRVQTDSVHAAVNRSSRLPDGSVEINDICDEIMRVPLENVDGSFFETLTRDDIFFRDSSHRVDQGSDVSAFFEEISPNFPKGML